MPNSRAARPGITPREVLGDDSGAIAALVDGVPWDLGRPLDHEAEVGAILAASTSGREILRHSTAHVLARAVCDLFPEAKYAIGPAIEDGFYYDFDVPVPFTPEDLERIDARMREIVAEDQPFVRCRLSREEGLARFADQPYKREIIESVDEAEGAGAEVTVYANDGWADLCRGPHVPSTAALGAFKLTHVAGAYWRGDEKRAQLQRVYGSAWESAEALAAYLHRLEEAERRDHRRLGLELDLFHFPPELGSGLPVFHPKGGMIIKAMRDYAQVKHEAADYQFVSTPHITKGDLFEISGHLGWFADSMYPPMHLEGHDYYVKPMNCPMHILVYQARQRSYRELPMRLFEFGTVYRFERSGVVHGLTRVRGLTMDDAHIFCEPAQVGEELRSLLTFMLGLLGDFGLSDFYLELSTRPEGKAIGSEAEWDEATEVLRTTAESADLELVLDPGGGAFYGPKISVQARDAIGRTWQISTLQVDFQLPQRFGLEYVGADNARHRPFMIHRALFGSIERFLGILLEHYAGALPTWLAPLQVQLVPIADRHVPYAETVAAALRAVGARVAIDATDERMQAKIRDAQLEKVPYILVLGDRDAGAGAVSVRTLDGAEQRGLPLAVFVNHLAANLTDRSPAQLPVP